MVLSVIRAESIGKLDSSQCATEQQSEDDVKWKRKICLI